MSLYRILIIGMILTSVAVGYVHQRVEIIKAGYILQGSRRHLARLVDQNSNLMYNLSKLESPKYLLASLDSEDMEFSEQRIRRTNNYNIKKADRQSAGRRSGFLGRLFDVFIPKLEARSRE